MTGQSSHRTQLPGFQEYFYVNIKDFYVVALRNIAVKRDELAYTRSQQGL